MDSDRETLEQYLDRHSPSGVLAAAIRAVLAEGERLREEVQSDIEHTAEWHLKWEEAQAENERLRAQALSMTVYAQGQEARIDAALEEADAALEMFEERSGLEEVVKALKGEA